MFNALSELIKGQWGCGRENGERMAATEQKRTLLLATEQAAPLKTPFAAMMTDGPCFLADIHAQQPASFESFWTLTLCLKC